MHILHKLRTNTSNLTSISCISSLMDSEVQTIARLAQWRVDHFGPASSRGSKAFKIGIWRWRLSLEQSRQYMHIRLYLEPSQPASRARFVFKISSLGRNYISPVHDRLVSTSKDFYWPIAPVFHGRLIIQVEFLKLKIWSSGEVSVVWPVGQLMRSRLTQNSTGGYLARMLDQGDNADVTINAYGGSVRAHKAVLRVASPVFDNMFRHNFKENESSTIDINDMSSDTLMALLRYLYETIEEKEFFEHRSALLEAANKYGIGELKVACEDSLLEDINSDNVLERLHEAWLYQLEKLKRECLSYLFNFGRIEDVRDRVEDFFTRTHRDFVVEMFQEVPRAFWNPAL